MPKSLESWMKLAQSQPAIRSLLTPRLNRWIPHLPTAKQAALLLLDHREVLYGGAAGGGKSEALLMAALQYVDLPGYAALLLRRSYTDLAQAGALMDRAATWLLPTAATWNESTKSWRFPSGATLRFGYLDKRHDELRYQSSEYQFIGFDELTQFAEAPYQYLFSRLRRGASVAIPLRMRAASNPGGPGHDWVKRRFLCEGPSDGRLFLPAGLDDNPHLDRQSYVASLSELDPLTRQRLLVGDWEIEDDGLIPFDDLLACAADCLWPDRKAALMARPELYLGVDVGRARDLSVVWTWEKVGDVYWCREILVMDRARFATQKKEIAARLTRHVVRCAVDQGGLGMQLAEELAHEFPGVVEGVTLASGPQGRIARRLKIALSERTVRIPDDANVRDDFRQVRQLRVVGGIDRFETARTSSGHADRFWAAALGLDAALASQPAKLPKASLPVAIRPSPEPRLPRR